MEICRVIIEKNNIYKRSKTEIIEDRQLIVAELNDIKAESFPQVLARRYKNHPSVVPILSECFDCSDKETRK